MIQEVQCAYTNVTMSQLICSTVKPSIIVDFWVLMDHTDSCGDRAAHTLFPTALTFVQTPLKQRAAAYKNWEVPSAKHVMISILVSAAVCKGLKQWV